MKKYYIGLAALTVFVAVITSIGLSQSLNFRADAKLKDDITHVKYSLESYINSHTTLPASLDEAKIEHSSKVIYITTGPATYQLCAVFRTDASADNYHSQPYYNESYDTYGYDWPSYHKIGRDCAKYIAHLKKVSIYDSPNVLCAEASYKVFAVSYGLVTAVDQTNNSLTVKFFSVAQTSATKTFNTDLLSKIFDSKCHVAKFTDIQVGSRLNIYQNHESSEVADGIYITQQGVVQPSRPID